MKKILIINKEMKKCNNNKDIEIGFSPTETQINYLLESIKLFGNINYGYLKFKWKNGRNYT